MTEECKTKLIALAQEIKDMTYDEKLKLQDNLNKVEVKLTYLIGYIMALKEI